MRGSYRRHSGAPPPPGLSGLSEANGEVHGPGVKLRHGLGRAGAEEWAADSESSRAVSVEEFS